MKKYFIFAAAALVALAACTKVETDPQTSPDIKIGYQVASYVSQTKAGEGHSFLTELSSLGVAASDQVFKSMAYIHADNGAGGTADPVQFFTAGTSGVEVISWNSTANEWAPAHTYYWPKSFRSNIDFFSWYDMAGTDPTISFVSPFSSVNMAWANRGVAFKDNVMWADAAWHYKGNEQTYQKDASSVEGVPTLFHHALAQLRFTIKQNPMKEEDSKNSGNYTFWEVKLNGVSIAANTVHNNGDLSLTQAAKAEKGVQAWTKPANDVWANASSPAYATLDGTTVFNTSLAKGTDGTNDVYLTNSEQYLTVDTNMPNNYFTVRPQDIANGVTITFTYTIKTWYGTETEYAKTNHGNCNLVSTETVNVNDLGPAVANAGAPYTNTGIQLNAISGAWERWQMNKMYTYKLIINPSSEKILYDPAVEDWAADVNATQTIPHA